MYGIVNKAIEDLICTQHGDAAWEEIKAQAGVEVEVFISNKFYPDELTHALVHAASKVLKLSTETIFEAFGEHWVLHMAQSGYSGLMLAAGRTLPEFLQNLPLVYARLALVFPRFEPPRVDCVDVRPGALTLREFAPRDGLTPFVVGLLKGLGQAYQMPVTVRVESRKGPGTDHTVFAVSWPPH